MVRRSLLEAPIWNASRAAHGDPAVPVPASAKSKRSTPAATARASTPAGAKSVSSFRLAFPDARILVAPGMDKSGCGLIAIDRDDLVIGATRAARQALGLTAETLARPRPVADIIGVPEGDLDAAERGVLRRALARTAGNASAAAQALGNGRATFTPTLKRLGLSSPD
jgi:transcriptional regulator of acetoin/glycerol metabolism